NTTFFDTNTKSTTVGVDLKYAFRPDTTFLIGFENTRFENVANSAAIGLAGITPEYRWITFGFHQNLSDAAKLILQYQISDIKNEFQ
ncbi:hypothetical protein C1X90_35035, partial [Pseudomonas sp. GP01-A9]|uniref:hypothetical protein n=1 Tax=Pseudomonas sp. GP01-A9 TaxID=2070564 RepID=UPI000CC6A901